MKHSYSATCECKRCRREHGRRLQQAKANHAQAWTAGRWPARHEAGMERWARRYDALNGAPEGDDDR